MRRFQNARRTEARRKAQRDRAQARIALAARERAAYVRSTVAEERSREEQTVFRMGSEEKVRYSNGKNGKNGKQLGRVLRFKIGLGSNYFF